jgi:plasmid maintenance system killer protein
MQIEFSNKNLEKLYLTGENRKYNYPKNIIDKFILMIQKIEAAESIYDLMRWPSLRFERLGGSNRFSISSNIKYRLEFEIDFEDDRKTRGKVKIMEYSKHYGD